MVWVRRDFRPRHLGAANLIRRLCSELLDRADYLLKLARLTVLDWLAPIPETPTDRAIREQGERIRKAFPQIDFDHPRAGRAARYRQSVRDCLG
jgi:hypothetical protein